MKTKNTFMLCAGFLLVLVCGNLYAQNTATAGETKLAPSPQVISNSPIKNPDVLVVTGRIIDAVTEKPVSNARINFEKFGEEMLQASIDEKGNYAIALSKKEMGAPIRVIFKIAGYKRYIIKNIDKAQSYIDADIFLQPMDSEEKSAANVKYTLSDDPFNTMVIQMQ